MNLFLKFFAKVAQLYTPVKNSEKTADVQNLEWVWQDTELKGFIVISELNHII